MIACSFPQSNHVFDKPENMSYDECDPLCVWVGPTQDNYPVVISCWKLTKEELEEINKTGRVWLTVFGRGMPPVALTVDTPFQGVPNG